MGKDIETLTSDNFKSKTLQGRCLVDFTAEWCGPCRMLAPILKEVADCHDEISIFKVDIDKNQDLAGEFNVTSVPTIVLLKDGKEADRFVGLKDKDDILKFIT